MGEIARLDDFAKDVAVFLSPTSRQQEIAAYAVGALAAAQVINRRALGRFPPYETTVDGRQGAPLTSVNPTNGVIQFDFQFLDPAVLIWILAALERYSPRRTGRFAANHVIVADGQEVDPSAIPGAKQFIIMNREPYARKIEAGLSRQASKGVYQLVAGYASKQFPDAKISFSYAPGLSSWEQASGLSYVSRRRGSRRRGQDWLSRQPAIIVDQW